MFYLSNQNVHNKNQKNNVITYKTKTNSLSNTLIINTNIAWMNPLK